MNGPHSDRPASDPSAIPPNEVQPTRRDRWRRRITILALVALLVTALGPLVLRQIGGWLMVEDPLLPSRAIFVHAGHVPFRAMEAATIFHQGVTSEVWLAAIASTAEEEALAELGIERPQGWYYSRLVLEELGVPPNRIRLLDEEVLDTEDEIRAVLAELEGSAAQRVILVTSKQHSRRVRVLWDLTAEDSHQASVRFAADDPFDPDSWWRTSGDAEAVLHELMGILNAWIGFPLRPER